MFAQTCFSWNCWNESHYNAKPSSKLQVSSECTFTLNIYAPITHVLAAAGCRNHFQIIQVSGPNLHESVSEDKMIQLNDSHAIKFEGHSQRLHLATHFPRSTALTCKDCA